MSTSLTATFTTRRDAELAIEHLIQEFGLDRDVIQVRADGDENSVGETTSGGDKEADGPSVEARHDAPVEGRIFVSVEMADGADVDAVERAFREFGGQRE